MKFANKSNEELAIEIKQLDKWKEIVHKLNPKDFFKENVKLLAVSMTFLFAWLLVRTFIRHEGQCYYLLQITVCSISIGTCILHIMNLYEIGIYLIDIRPQVEEINGFLKRQEDIKTNEPNQVPNGGPEAV